MKKSFSKTTKKQNYMRKKAILTYHKDAETMSL